MSVSDSSTIRFTYSGNGVKTDFSFPHYFLEDEDILAIIKAADLSESEKTLNTHYTVSGEGNEAGGTVSFVTAPATGETVVLMLNMRRHQPLDLEHGGNFNAEAIEESIDRTVLIEKRLRFQIERALRLRDGHTATFDPLLPATLTADKVLAVNSSGDGITLGPTVSSLGVVPSNITIDRFSGNGVTTAFTLSVTPNNENMTWVYVAGVYQQKNTYSVSGTTLTFSAAPANGSNNIEVAIVTELSIGTPADNSVSTGKLQNQSVTTDKLGAIVYNGWAKNLGLIPATTTNANDSIKIQGAAAALSSDNPLSVTLLNQGSVGRVLARSTTADVTINLTGAHWGFGTLGDFTDVELFVYAIAETDGSLKWGVSRTAGYVTITTALSSATATDINLETEMLVTATLTGTMTCVMVGSFHANFDDTGGAAEDLWAVTSTIGKIKPGPRSPKAPTVQKFTSGSGTYTRPSNPAPLYIQPVLVGGGAGGGGSGTTSGTAATAGGNTTFGTSLLSANGGAIGARDADGGVGGTASLGTGPAGIALQGGSGGGSARQHASETTPATIPGGQGGSSAFGGAGLGGSIGGAGSGAGGAGVTNTGGGGGGGAASANNGVNSGSGGGAGGYIDAIITNPNATYAYAVGAGGTGQAAGTNGFAGGAGGSGIIVVYEYYQ